MHPMFKELFIDTDTDDLAAEQGYVGNQQRKARDRFCSRICRLAAGQSCRIVFMRPPSGQTRQRGG